MLTDICDPPDDWDVVSLRDMIESGEVELGRGNVISKKEMRSKPGNYPVYSSSVTNNGKIGEYGEYMFDEEMITWSVDGGGHLFYRPKHKFSVTNIGGYIRLHTDEIDYRWLHGLLSLQHGHITFDYQLKAHPSVIKDIYQVFDVPIEEQRRIADVLDTVDAAIQETDNVVEKQEQVKTGLLQDLLTRGLDAEGRLRDPEREPEAFRRTKHGLYPKEWSIYRLGEVAESAIDGPFGSNLKTSHYVDQPGVQVVRLQNIGHGVFDDSDRAYVSREHARTLKRHKVVGGDLLVASLGDDTHPPGRSCQYPYDKPPAINKADCFRVRVREDLAVPRFVMHLLNCSHTRKDISGLVQGVTRDRINLTNLKRVRLPLPPKKEQRRIVERLATETAHIDFEKAYRSKLRDFKTGLMQDLLTGRVRVPEAEARVDEVVA